MVFSITLPDQYGYVALATASFFWLTQWQGLNVSKYRKLAKIPYPQAYADKAQQEASKEALQFNCAQRAHQNTLETLPIVMATTLFTGIKYPIFAASTALAWSFARVLYTFGYSTGDPKKRNSLGGGLAHLLCIVQGLAMTWYATEMAMGW
ncbi:hypothetical protein FRC03_000464 [Tulasnella sp. 419]|nr:hypothetical protein FRC03_000464 [Tulasnella sp. 419]